MEISKIRPYEGYYDNSIGRVTGNSGSDQISNPIENFSTGKMQSVKPEQKRLLVQQSMPIHISREKNIL